MTEKTLRNAGLDWVNVELKFCFFVFLLLDGMGKEEETLSSFTAM